MKFSIHAKVKLKIYGLSEKEILDACRFPAKELYDVNEKENVLIIHCRGVLIVVILKREFRSITTVYATDAKTISTRKKNKRWI